ncbi:MAG: lysoplasmalogenase [Myxococcales bacterium]|nr:lysoplasmalogenase [Myxococcales bacterium]
MTPYAALCVAATVTLLLSIRRQPTTTRPPTIRVLAKTTASVAFVMHAVAMGAPDQGPPGALLLVALGLSVVGDVCLLFRRGFLPGLAAFLLAHLAFAAAFVSAGVATAGVLVSLAPLALVAWSVWRWLAPRARVRSMGPAVGAYILAIVAMTACAFGLLAAGPTPLRWTLAAAAVLFLVSDLFVARERFVRASFHNRLAGLPLYYGAQLLFGTASGGLS